MSKFRLYRISALSEQTSQQQKCTSGIRIYVYKWNQNPCYNNKLHEMNQRILPKLSTGLLHKAQTFQTKLRFQPCLWKSIKEAVLPNGLAWTDRHTTRGLDMEYLPKHIVPHVAKLSLAPKSAAYFSQVSPTSNEITLEMVPCQHKKTT